MLAQYLYSGGGGSQQHNTTPKSVYMIFDNTPEFDITLLVAHNTSVTSGDYLIPPGIPNTITFIMSTSTTPSKAFLRRHNVSNQTNTPILL